MHPLDPFYRNGKSAPLTATDYANITGVSFWKAKGLLTKLVNMKKVRRIEFDYQSQFVLPDWEENQ